MKHSIFTVPNLPTELITEVLLRLPVKPLLIFKSVSKSWLTLITSPEFIRTHLTIAANNKDYTHHRLMMKFLEPKNHFVDCSLRSLLIDSVMDTSDLEFSSHNRFVVGSVNGLVCLAIAKDSFIWNPSIRKCKKLPDSKAKLLDVNSTHGFGYDEVHDDYKVVGVFYDAWNINYEGVEIYSLKSDSWRTIPFNLQDKVKFNSMGTFVNGKLHWVDVAIPSRYDDPSIIYIDLVGEKWGKMKQPCYREGSDTFRLGVLGSNLSMFCNYKNLQLDVWITKEYGVKAAWTKIYTIDYPYNDQLSWTYKLLRPTIVAYKGEILLVFGATWMTYNPKDDSISGLKISHFYDCFDNEIYIESLVCPLSHNNGHNRNDGSSSSNG